MSGKVAGDEQKIFPRLEVVGWDGSDSEFEAMEVAIGRYVASAAMAGLSWDEVREDIAERYYGVLDAVCVHAQPRRAGGLHVLVLGHVAVAPALELRVRTEIRDWHGSDEDFKRIEADVCGYVRAAHAYGQAPRETLEDLRERYADLFVFVGLDMVEAQGGHQCIDFVAAVRSPELED